MPRPIPNRVVARLPDTIPFIAPEVYEREMGMAFTARIGANESVFGASPRAVAAMQEAANATQWYGDPTSHDLRTALAAKHKLNTDQFVVGSGIDGLFSVLASAYFAEGDKVVTTLGSYPTFNYFVDAIGAELVQVPYCQDFSVDLDALAAKAKEVGAKAVYLANPDNPSGTFHTGEAIAQFVAKLPEDILFILDEAYIDFVDSYDVCDPRIIRLRTFSKAYGMAGMRVGYAFGDHETVQPLNRVRPHFEVNILAQAGALASLEDQTFIPSIRQRADESRKQLRNILDKAGLPSLPSSTNFVLGDAGSKERAERIVKELRDHRIFIRKPGLPPLDGHVRISLGLEQDYEVLATALNQIRL